MKYLMVFAIFVYVALILAGAKTHYLWSDEAETVNFARNVNRYGIPKGFDGVNLVGYYGGALLNKDLVNNKSPWLQFYLTAFSIRFFGESPFAARLPFLVFAVMSLRIIFLLVQKISKSDTVSYLTIIILCLNVQFILYTYQARYYSLVLFFGTSFLYNALCLSEKKWKNRILLMFSIIGYLYSHQVTIILLLPSTLLALTYYWKKQGENWKKIREYSLWYCGLASISLLFYLPWFLIYQPSDPGMMRISLPVIQYLQFIYSQCVHALLRFNDANIFPVGVIGLLTFILIRLKKKAEKLHQLIFIIIVFVSYFTLVIALGTMFSFDLTNPTDGRYHIVMLVCVSILAALLFDEVKQKKVVFAVMLFLFLFTNLFTLRQPRIFLVEYLNELWKAPPSPEFEVAQYLKEHAKDGETIFVNLERNHDPLIYYLEKKLKFINRIAPNDPILKAKGHAELPSYIYFYNQEPDWVILFSNRMGHDELTVDYRGPFPRGLFETVDINNYELTELPIFFADMSRPEMDMRSFMSITPEPDDHIFIFHKTKK